MGEGEGEGEGYSGTTALGGNEELKKKGKYAVIAHCRLWSRCHLKGGFQKDKGRGIITRGKSDERAVLSGEGGERERRRLLTPFYFENESGRVKIKG